MRRAPVSPQSTAAKVPVPSSLVELAVFVDDTIEVHPLPPRGVLSIGRSSDNDIRINHSSVSRRHALLHLEPGLWLEDLGGVNGTHVHPPGATHSAAETQRSIASKTVELSLDDHITFGSVMSVIRSLSSQPLNRLGDEPPSLAATSRDGVTVLSDPAMRVLYDRAALAAQSLINVLLLGETGVGKDVLARTIHNRSPRAAGPFLALNCSALPESLLEGELFGYERGTFTGASQPRAGLFESAEGGTVFLDEAGELPMSTQVKLLRVLEERQVLRLGSRVHRSIDVRFIAATNRDLQARIASGAFRLDLFYRLNGFPITIPPLRQRIADIAPLAEIFAAKACRDLQCPAASFSAEALALLERYAWPGNVRELRNVVEGAVVCGRGGEICPEHLPSYLVEDTTRGSAPPLANISLPDSVTQPIPRPRKGTPEERERILAALAACNGNQTQAAKLLRFSRRTLISRLDELDVIRPRKKEQGSLCLDRSDGLSGDEHGADTVLATPFK